MTLPVWVKLLHVVLVLGFTGGLIGRWLVLRSAARSDDVEFAHRLSEVAVPFERLVIWGSFAVPLAGLITAWAQGYSFLGLRTGWMLVSFVLLLTTIPIVPLVFIPRGRVFATQMEAARRAGRVTEGLRAAFNDSAVAAARTYELAVVAVIVALMVLKPF
jgi:uncharacterized membrane protein